MTQSIMKRKAIIIGDTPHLVVVTAQRTENDFNGNPQALVQVWTTVNGGHVWYPKMKGYRDRNDMSYKVQAWQGMDEAIEELLVRFELTLNNRL